jgi:glycine cleavage system pyridoxal-binding protein P
MSAKTPSLRELEQHDAFIERHIGPNDAEIARMLRTVGFDSLEAMTDAIVPGSIKSPAPLALPEAISETTARTRRMSSCATSSRIRRGTRPTRRTRPRFRRAAWKR